MLAAGWRRGQKRAGALAYFEASGSFKTGLPGQALAHEGELGGSAWLMHFTTLLARPAPGAPQSSVAQLLHRRYHAPWQTCEARDATLRRSVSCM